VFLFYVGYVQITFSVDSWCMCTKDDGH